MRDGFKVIDTERHVVEPATLWETYLDPRYRDRAPRWVAEGSLGLEVAGKAMFDGGREILAAVEPGDQFVEARAAGFSAASNLRDMDREGVDIAVLFPSAGLYAIWGDHVPPDLSAAICRAYNDWLADYCRTAPDRLKGVAMVPLHDVAASVDEATRAVRELGFAGVLARPNPLLKRQLFDQAYTPFYAALETLGVPLCLHSSPGCILPEIGVKDFTGLERPEGVQRFTGISARTVISYPFEMMGALISMAGEEPMMNHPGLKVLFASGGAGWLFFWMERIDDEWFHRGNDAITKLKPGHYFGRQGLVAAHADEGMIPYLTHEFGDNLAWGSAYPHPLATGFPDALDRIIGHPRLDAEAKRRILWDNPARLFNLQ